MNVDRWCIVLYSLFAMASGRPWASSLLIFRYGCNKEYSRWQSSVRIIWNLIVQWQTAWQYRQGTHLRPVSLLDFLIDSAESPQSVSAYHSSLSVIYVRFVSERSSLLFLDAITLWGVSFPSRSQHEGAVCRFWLSTKPPHWYALLVGHIYSDIVSTVQGLSKMRRLGRDVLIWLKRAKWQELDL